MNLEITLNLVGQNLYPINQQTRTALVTAFSNTVGNVGRVELLRATVSAPCQSPLPGCLQYGRPSSGPAGGCLNGVRPDLDDPPDFGPLSWSVSLPVMAWIATVCSNTVGCIGHVVLPRATWGV